MVDFEGKHRVKRGEVWTIAGGPDYAGKPRPAIIIQSDKFDATPSVTVCPLTGTPVDNVHARFAIAPTQANGLEVTSHVMVDKISTLPKSKLGRYLGQLDANDLSRLSQRVTLFLGLAE
jgi:mRNA interferase MazF